MLETDLQHGVRRGRFLRVNAGFAGRYGNGVKSCPNGRRDSRAPGPLVPDAHASEN